MVIGNHCCASASPKRKVTHTSYCGKKKQNTSGFLLFKFVWLYVVDYLLSKQLHRYIYLSKVRVRFLFKVNGSKAATKTISMSSLMKKRRKKVHFSMCCCRNNIIAARCNNYWKINLPLKNVVNQNSLLLAKLIYVGICGTTIAIVIGILSM